MFGSGVREPRDGRAAGVWSLYIWKVEAVEEAEARFAPGEVKAIAPNLVLVGARGEVFGLAGVGEARCGSGVGLEASF